MLIRAILSKLNRGRDHGSHGHFITIKNFINPERVLPLSDFRRKSVGFSDKGKLEGVFNLSKV